MGFKTYWKKTTNIQNNLLNYFHIFSTIWQWGIITPWVWDSNPVTLLLWHKILAGSKIIFVIFPTIHKNKFPQKKLSQTRVFRIFHYVLSVTGTGKNGVWVGAGHWLGCHLGRPVAIGWYTIWGLALWIQPVVIRTPTLHFWFRH